jgi:hypothetical protein
MQSKSEKIKSHLNTSDDCVSERVDRCVLHGQSLLRTCPEARHDERKSKLQITRQLDIFLPKTQPAQSDGGPSKLLVAVERAMHQSARNLIWGGPLEIMLISYTVLRSSAITNHCQKEAKKQNIWFSTLCALLEVSQQY